MKVKLMLHGHLKDLADPAPGEPRGAVVVVPAGHSCVVDLLAQVGLPLSEVGFVARNGIMCGVESQLADGDEVAVFPVLAGG